MSWTLSFSDLSSQTAQEFNYFDPSGNTGGSFTKMPMTYILWANDGNWDEFTSWVDGQRNSDGSLKDGATVTTN